MWEELLICSGPNQHNYTNFIFVQWLIIGLLTRDVFVFVFSVKDTFSLSFLPVLLCAETQTKKWMNSEKIIAGKKTKSELWTFKNKVLFGLVFVLCDWLAIPSKPQLHIRHLMLCLEETTLKPLNIELWKINSWLFDVVEFFTFFLKIAIIVSNIPWCLSKIRLFGSPRLQ